MNLRQRIDALVAFGNFLNSLTSEEKTPVFQRAYIHNHWFTLDNIHFAFDEICQMLKKESLENWLQGYSLDEIGSERPPKNIGIVMAGNIPFVGFHDLLSVLASGHVAWVKPSQKDTVLIQKLIEWLLEVEPQFKFQVQLRPNLKGADAYIATGSNNTARYFDYYFGKFPHIIRKNRSSVAVLNGEETQEDLENLAKDVFQYFGLGCRNVSKLYVPQNYDFGKLLDTFYLQYKHLKDHNKYANNYDYYRAIYLMEQIPHFDAFNILLTKHDGIASPTGVLYYEMYQDTQDVLQKLQQHNEAIQVVVSKNNWIEGSEHFGNAQLPKITDYADGVDTLAFLEQL